MEKHSKRGICITLSFKNLLLVILLAVTSVTYAKPNQIQTVSGIVTSKTDGEPLIGVSVRVSGTTIGTITDVDGKFSLNNVTNSSVIVFSYIGYRTQSVEVGQQSNFDIQLIEDNALLDEVVVVGYGVQKKKLVTGATAQVSGEKVQALNSLNPLQAMQGQTPGVTIVSTAGQPGSDMKVTIRGMGTIGNAAPLYLIDGVGGDISTLNPADIESIDVLKDAASAAIYGAQAANGVVLITTKKGKEGKAEISFDGYYGWQNVAKKLDVLNAEEYKMIMDEQSINSGGKPYDWEAYKTIQGVDSDWVGSMFKDNAVTQNYSLGIRGGNKTSNFALTLSYMSQEGIVGGKDVSNYERYNFRINSEHKLFDGKLTVGEHVSFVDRISNGVRVGGKFWNTLRGAFYASPLIPIYGENRYDTPFYDSANSDWDNQAGNPYGFMKTVLPYNKSDNRALSGDVYADLEVVKNLKLKTVFGAVYNGSEFRNFTPLYQFSIYTFNNTRTSVDQNMNQSLSMTWTNTLSYCFNVKKNNFSVLLGMEAYRYKGMGVSASNGGLKEGFDDWDHAYIDNGTSTSKDNGLSAGGAPHNDARSVSYFGRVGWDYKEKYLATVTLRADGSSKFARGNRFGYFPSISAGWIMSEEDFMKERTNWLSYLKLRASWGQVGNQNISDYQYLAPIKTTNSYYIFGTNKGAEAQAPYWGAYPSRLSNSKIKWETSEQFNVGVDANLFNKLNVNADFYIKTTKDWLVQAPILATAGTGAPFINGGRVKNTGVELALAWNDRIGNDFQYQIGLNGSYNKNKVGEIPTDDGIIHGTNNELYDPSAVFYRAENGHPIGYFWGFETAGLFQNKQEIESWCASGNGVLQSDPQPGDVRFVDQNRDGVIDDKDKIDLGNGLPDMVYGFNASAQWKGFDFSILFNGQFGNKIVKSYRDNAKSNYTSDFLGRWHGEGTSNHIPRVTENNINWLFSDLYVHNGSFLRISNVTLGYP